MFSWITKYIGLRSKHVATSTGFKKKLHYWKNEIKKFPRKREIFFDLIVKNLLFIQHHPKELPMQYTFKVKVPPFSFFGIVRLFKKNLQSVPFIFLEFCDKMDVEPEPHIGLFPSDSLESQPYDFDAIVHIVLLYGVEWL